MTENKNTIFNVSGGQVNYAQDNAIINATQNNGTDINGLDSIIKEIRENLSYLEKEDAENVEDVLETVQEELEKTVRFFWTNC